MGIKKLSKKPSKNSSKKVSNVPKKIQWKNENIKPRNIYSETVLKLEPIKVIYKYKNNNRKNQYITYIYVGNLGKKYSSIFNKIEKLNLYDTLLILTNQDELKLIDGFGDLWMTKFFNIYHISSFVNKIENKPELKKELLKKYDELWIEKFISKFKDEVILKKINYSYGDLIKQQYKIRMGKKLEKIIIEKEDIEDISFISSDKIYNKSANILNNMSKTSTKSQIGGDNDNDNDGGDIENNDDDYVDEDPEEPDLEAEINEESHGLYGVSGKNIDQPDDLDSEYMDEDIISDIEESEEMDVDDMEKLYQEDEIDLNASLTGVQISNILENKIIEKKTNYIIKFDDDKDNDIDNCDISQVYDKKFVYSQYIFKDDSIKTVKNKICSSIKANEKFGSDAYIIPSRMYIWSEYLINNKLQKIMIGQKWMKKNDLLNIDIEPLPISKYENLEDPIKNLRDILKRYAGKIRREDEENNILYDYSDYILNDTIYMVDIYNELGKNYKPNNEQIRNLTDTYFKIYFPKIRTEDIKGILDFLSDIEIKNEETKISNVFDTIYNSIVIEKEITDLIETTKINKRSEYMKIFEDGNFITQSVIHVNLDIYDEQLEIENKENLTKINNETGEYGSVLLPKLDLFRIFNDFTPDIRYPFIQYQVPDGQIIMKYYEPYMYEFSKSKDNIEMITKWFENSPYGISFKVRLSNFNSESNSEILDKFMAINIGDIGKVEYKTQWKEEDSANIHDIINTYSYVKELVTKINSTLLNHPRKISIRIPEDHEFKFAFINCIQKFKLPGNKIINHNDFSEFSRFFFPYVALVIEPRKRISKASTAELKSKYGSYLRYKRVSKFENQGKIEQRILSYLRNFDIDDNLLAEEISKQFNITIDKTKEEITKVKGKFSNLTKGKKSILKKTEVVPKFKSPGIGIDIQGKIPEKYKIRISGAREQIQLERIITFLNVLMYLYAETYITKNPEYQIIKEKLRKLTHIAKRINKVDEIVDYKKNPMIVKQMTQIDKKRLGFTPDEGQNQWTRSCQNSGNDKKRRPKQTIMTNISELVAKGYALNKKTGDYEKKISLKRKGKKDYEIVLKTIKVSDPDETSGIANDIYYSCNPDDNGQHMYIGFLTRSNNPFGECMPCCFKKNPFISKKKEKQDFYKRCLGEKNILDDKIITGIIGDILYILQDTNKIQDGRIGYLPKFLDLITNIHFKKEKYIKNHYLLQTSSYFFKYGIKQDDYSFINTISTVLNMGVDQIKTLIIDFLKTDTDEMYYYSLNDGDIRAEYKINDFIRFIKDEDYLDYYYLNDLLKIKGLFTKRGILPIVFNKSQTIIKRGIEREKIKEDFYISVDKTMVTDFEYCMNMFDKKDILILIKDGKFYYPIVEIIKNDEISKNIQIKKLFNASNSDDSQLINLIKNFFQKTIADIKIDYIKTHTSAKETCMIIKQLSKEKPNWTPQFQVIDSRFKCKYIITKDNSIIPVIPSGIIEDLPTICLNSEVTLSGNKSDCFSKINYSSLKKTQDYLEELFIKSNSKLNVKPIGLFYDNIDDDAVVNIIGIITSNNDLVPIIPVGIPRKELDKNKVSYQNRPLYHELDQKLLNYSKDNFQIIDNRIKNVNKAKYLEESYQLFKYELSNLLSDKIFYEYKNTLKKLIKLKDTEKIQDLILELSVQKIDNSIVNPKNTTGVELVKIINELPDLSYYKINNQRNICDRLDVDTCVANPHCAYTQQTVSKAKLSSTTGKCMFALDQNHLLEFIKKISVEMVEQDVKAFEILKEKKYYVSDIVDYNNFTEKVGQKIIKSSNTNLQKILGDIFGKEHVPKIGRRYLSKKIELDLQTLQLENSLKDVKDAYSQTIIPYNYSIVRAYINGYYWIKHNLYTIDSRNLGYYSEMQNEIINLFRSMIIDWLNVPDNIYLLTNLDIETKNFIKDPIVFSDGSSNQKLIINNFIIRLMENSTENNLGLFELFIINKIHNIPIIILVNGVATYYINEHIAKFDPNDSDKDKYLSDKNICINLDVDRENQYPALVEVIYYKNTVKI